MAARCSAGLGVLALGLGLVSPASASPVSAGQATAATPERGVAARVVGSGSPSSCTSGAVVKAVKAGGKVTFDCGSDPVVIVMKRTAKILNTNPKTIIDGGGLVTLSGAGTRRIIYQNTCDPKQVWTTDHCQDQKEPLLVLKRLRLVRGNSTGDRSEGGGGGAVFVRGGRLKVVDSVFDRNRCDRVGPDLGGAAIRVLSHWSRRPVKVSGSTFTRGRCSNGAAVSSIGVSWQVRDSVFRRNKAIGRGANPARPGSPGGGSGGAIYLDGNTFTLRLARVRMENNRAREGGGAIFFVSNDRSGAMTISASTLRSNPSAGFENYPGIFFLGKNKPKFINGTIVQ
ncbi:hypothetical protein [Nocardioides sp.]|uniref:hypothetical protein n=1 Tax=Nocardioides sp. TaxID=35761 RepID=UPI003568F6DE